MKNFPNEFEDDFDDDQGGESGDSGEGGRGGKSSTETGPRIRTEIHRDDMLSPQEIQRLLQVHGDLNKAYVDKQKALRSERAAIKEGKKTHAQIYQQGRGLGGGGTMSRFKKHPISDRAQFSGIDRQVSNLPTEYDADTNAENRNELENRYNHRYQPQQKFNPKPSPF